MGVCLDSYITHAVEDSVQPPACGRAWKDSVFTKAQRI